jgi:DNA-binding transcriptional LysR family regulator
MPDSNFMDVQLRDLHLLQVMLSEGSLTRAAALLDTTQPTLSKALARLRLQLDDPLLVRDGQIMRPTPKGSAMLTPLRNLLSSARGLAHPESMAFDPQSSNHRFRLLVSDVGMILFLPALTARLAAAGPGLKLEPPAKPTWRLGPLPRRRATYAASNSIPTTRAWRATTIPSVSVWRGSPNFARPSIYS